MTCSCVCLCFSAHLCVWEPLSALDFGWLCHAFAKDVWYSQACRQWDNYLPITRSWWMVRERAKVTDSAITSSRNDTHVCKHTHSVLLLQRVFLCFTLHCVKAASILISHPDCNWEAVSDTFGCISNVSAHTAESQSLCFYHYKLK